MVVSAGLRFQDRSGPLGEREHKYIGAQNVGNQGKRLKQSFEGCVLFFILCLFHVCTLKHFSDFLSSLLFHLLRFKDTSKM